MRNEFSDVDIQLLAAAEAGHGGLSADDLKRGTGVAGQIKLQFRRAFQAVMASQPWSFATKRVELQLSSEMPVVSSIYSRFFELPRDIRKVWDLYVSSLTPYIETPLYNRLSYPFADGLIEGIGEIIGDKIASDYNLSILYTTSDAIDFRKYSAEFTEILISTTSKYLEKGKDLPADQMALKYNIRKKEDRELKADAARENRRAYRIAPPTIIANISHGGDRARLVGPYIRTD